MNSKKGTKNIGIKLNPPSKSCEDANCPFHGSLVVKGRSFTGVVVAKDIYKTATIEWDYKLFVQKYERYVTKRTRVHVHNPSCIDAQVGDKVRIIQTRPLSKTKNFVIVENLGKEKGFEEKIAAEEESKEIIGKKERKKEAPVANTETVKGEQ